MIPISNRNNNNNNNNNDNDNINNDKRENDKRERSAMNRAYVDPEENEEFFDTAIDDNDNVNDDIGNNNNWKGDNWEGDTSELFQHSHRKEKATQEEETDTQGQQDGMREGDDHHRHREHYNWEDGPASGVAPVTTVLKAPMGSELLIDEQVKSHYVFVIPGSTIYSNAARKWGDCKDRIRGVIGFILHLVRFFQDADIFMEVYEAQQLKALDKKKKKKKNNNNNKRGRQEDESADDASDDDTSSAAAAAAASDTETTTNARHNKRRKGENGRVVRPPPLTLDVVFGEKRSKSPLCQPPKMWYEIIPSERDRQHRAAYAIHILNTNSEIDIVQIMIEYLCEEILNESKQELTSKNVLRRFKNISGDFSSGSFSRSDRDSVMSQSELLSVLETYMKFGNSQAHYDPDPKLCPQDNIRGFFFKCMSPSTANRILQAQCYRKSVLTIDIKSSAALIPDGTIIEKIGRSLKGLDFIPVRVVTAIDPLQQSFPDEALLNEASFVNKVMSMQFRPYLEDMPQWEIERQEALGKITNNCDEGAYCTSHHSGKQQQNAQYNDESDDNGAYSYLRTSNDVFKILWIIHRQEFEGLQSQGTLIAAKEDYIEWSQTMRKFNEKRFIELRDYILSPIASNIIQRLMSPPIKSCREFLNVTCGSPDGKRRLFYDKVSNSYCGMVFRYGNMDALANFLIYMYEMSTKILCIGKVNIHVFLSFFIGGLNQFLMVPQSDGNALNYNVIIQGTSGGGKSYLFQLLTQYFIQGTTTQMDSKSHQSGISDTLMNAFVRFNDELPSYYSINPFGSSDKDAQPLEQEKTLETKGSLLREVCVILPNGKRITQMFQTDVHGARFIATNKPESAIDPTIKTRKLIFTKIPPEPSEIQQQQQQARRYQTANPSAVRSFKSVIQSLQSCIMMSFVSRNIYAVPPMDYKMQTVLVLALEKMLDYLHGSSVFIRGDLYPNRVKEGVLLFANMLCMLQGWVEYCIHPMGPGYQKPFDEDWIRDVARLQYPRLQAVVFSLCVHLECFIPPSMTTVINGIFEKVIPVEAAVKGYFSKNYGLKNIPFVPSIDSTPFYLLCMHDWMKANFRSEDYHSSADGTGAGGGIGEAEEDQSTAAFGFNNNRRQRFDFSANGPTDGNNGSTTGGFNAGRQKYNNNNGRGGDGSSSGVGVSHASFRTRRVGHTQYIDVNYISLTVDTEYALSRSFLQRERTKSVYDEKTIGLGYELLRKLMVYPRRVYAYIQENEFPTDPESVSLKFGDDSISETIMKALWSITIQTNLWDSMVTVVSVVAQEEKMNEKKARWKKFFSSKKKVIITHLLKALNPTITPTNTAVHKSAALFVDAISLAIDKITCGVPIPGSNSSSSSNGNELEPNPSDPIFKAVWKVFMRTTAKTTTTTPMSRNKTNWLDRIPDEMNDMVVNSMTESSTLDSSSPLTYLEAIVSSAFDDFIPTYLTPPSTTFLGKLKQVKDGKSLCGEDKNHLYQEKIGFPGLQVEKTANNKYIYHFHVALFQRNTAKVLRNAIRSLGCFVTVPRKILALLDCELEPIDIAPLSSNPEGSIDIEMNMFTDRGPQKCPDPTRSDMVIDQSVIEPDNDRRHPPNNVEDETAAGRWVRELQNTSSNSINIQEDMDVFFARVYLEQLATPWEDIKAYLPALSVDSLRLNPRCQNTTTARSDGAAIQQPLVPPDIISSGASSSSSSSRTSNGGGGGGSGVNSNNNNNNNPPTQLTTANSNNVNGGMESSYGITTTTTSTAAARQQQITFASSTTTIAVGKKSSDVVPSFLEARRNRHDRYVELANNNNTNSNLSFGSTPTPTNATTPPLLVVTAPAFRSSSNSNAAAVDDDDSGDNEDNHLIAALDRVSNLVDVVSNLVGLDDDATRISFSNS